MSSAALQFRVRKTDGLRSVLDTCRHETGRSAGLESLDGRETSLPGRLRLFAKEVHQVANENSNKASLRSLACLSRGT